jgi:hypothetical protein
VVVGVDWSECSKKEEEEVQRSCYIARDRSCLQLKVKVKRDCAAPIPPLLPNDRKR